MPWSFTVPNRNTPRTAYKYNSKISRPPTLVKAGKETKNVVNIKFRLLNLLISLKILPTLRALTIVAWGPTEIEVVRDRIIPTIVPITIRKSKTFQESWKYCLPIPISLRTASSVKMNAKT